MGQAWKGVREEEKYDSVLEERRRYPKPNLFPLRFSPLSLPLFVLALQMLDISIRDRHVLSNNFGWCWVV